LVSVSVVLTYKGTLLSSTLPHCLDCIHNQTCPPDEVILIDGNKEGQNETESILIGFKKAKGEILFSTNVDCYVPRDWIESHLRWHGRGYPLVSGLRVERGEIGSSRNPLTKGDALFEQRPNIGVTGSNFSISKNILSKITWPRMRHAWDMEISLQVPKFVIDTSVIVVHDHPFKNLKDSYVKAFQYSVWALEMIRLTNSRITMGGRSGVRISLKNVLFEALQVNPVRVYRKYGEGSLPRFLFNRFVFRLGQFSGLVYGVLFV